MAKAPVRSKVVGEATARRKFIRHVGRVAVTAPAVALLVAASSKPAAAQYGAQAQPRRRAPRRRHSGVTEPAGDQ